MQGCILPSLHSQCVMDELEDLKGMKIGCWNLNDIRYVYDTVIIADSEEKTIEAGVETLYNMRFQRSVYQPLNW